MASTAQALQLVSVTSILYELPTTCALSRKAPSPKISRSVHLAEALQ